MVGDHWKKFSLFVLVFLTLVRELLCRDSNTAQQILIVLALHRSRKISFCVLFGTFLPLVAVSLFSLNRLG
jgi:hypothetical protein